MKPSDVVGWIYIGASVYFGAEACDKRDKLLEYLEADSLNPKIHKDFLTGLNKLKGLDNRKSALVYSRVLEILINNPDNPQATNLVYKTGQWYFKSQTPTKVYTLDDLFKIQTFATKKRELDGIITKLENYSEEDFLQASKWINHLDFTEFEDDVVKSKLITSKDEFIEKLSTSLLRRLTEQPTNSELQSLLKTTMTLIRQDLALFQKPDPSYYEAFLISFLNHVVNNPRNKTHKEFLMYSLEKAPGIGGVNSLNIYNTVLDLFENSSSQKDIRVLVLDIGRWHFSRKNWIRQSPKPEDEQQMQNDILMRLKS